MGEDVARVELKLALTAVGRVLLPFRRRAAAMFVQFAVEESEGGEIFRGEDGLAQVEKRERQHDNRPAGRCHVVFHVVEVMRAEASLM